MTEFHTIQPIKGIYQLLRFFATHPLTRDRQLAAWYRFARWQIESRIRAEVLVPWVGDLRLAARRSMTGATGNIYAGVHEFSDMMLVCHLLRRGDLFVDVGANIGSYSLLAGGVARADVIAFEPDPDTAVRFLRNMALNNLESAVELHEAAVGEREGVVAFTMGLDTANQIAIDNHTSTREVRQTKLDDAVAGRSPVMIKVDVEGFEEQVVRGAPVVLSNPSLKVIALETVTDWVSDALNAHGFERRHYDPFSRRLLIEPIYASSNTLFVRDFEFVRQRLATARPLEVLGRSI